MSLILISFFFSWSYWDFLSQEIKQYIIYLTRQQELRDAEDNLIKQQIHEEIMHYFNLYISWNSPNYLGPVKTRVRLCKITFCEARATNHWLNDKGCYNNTIIGCYTNAKGEQCKVFLGSSMRKAIDYCKRCRIWQDNHQ